MELGLPHGQGWINEQEWLIILYKQMKKCYDSCINAIELKEIKKHGKSTANN